MFITLEGIDGSGKSTQAKRVFSYIEDKIGAGRTIWTREPGGWPGGELLRNMILHEDLKHHYSELYLFMADRCEHVRHVIEPALKSGKHVLCERYTDSTLAYQCWGRGISFDRVDSLFRWSDFPVPDVTIWVDMPLEKALKLIGKRGEADRMESDHSFLARVRDGFVQLHRRYPDRIIRINGDQTPDEVTEDILSRLDGLKWL